MAWTFFDTFRPPESANDGAAYRELVCRRRPPALGQKSHESTSGTMLVPRIDNLQLDLLAEVGPGPTTFGPGNSPKRPRLGRPGATENLCMIVAPGAVIVSTTRKSCRVLAWGTDHDIEITERKTRVVVTSGLGLNRPNTYDLIETSGSRQMRASGAPAARLTRVSMVPYGNGPTPYPHVPPDRLPRVSGATH